MITSTFRNASNPFFPIRFILLCCMLLNLSGCGVVLIGGAAAAGTVGYVSGELNAVLDSSYEAVVAATNQAIAENSITEISKTPEEYQVSYVLRTLHGDKVHLEITYATKDLTNMSIRIGTFGNEPLSKQILDEIESRLNN